MADKRGRVSAVRSADERGDGPAAAEQRLRAARPVRTDCPHAQPAGRRGGSHLEHRLQARGQPQALDRLARLVVRQSAPGNVHRRRRRRGALLAVRQTPGSHGPSDVPDDRRRALAPGPRPGGFGRDLGRARRRGRGHGRPQRQQRPDQYRRAHDAGLCFRVSRSRRRFSSAAHHDRDGRRVGDDSDR